MRRSEEGNFFLCDKAAVQYFKEIKGRPFSKAEAYLSFSKDINCGVKWTISGYAKQWGWTRWKVRKFTSDLLKTTGQTTDSQATPYRHPIHVIERENSRATDIRPTSDRHQTDTTIRVDKEKSKDYVGQEQKNARPPRKMNGIPYAKIVDYLNGKVGSNFRPTTQVTKRFIKARWQEGFKLDDFKAVIDVKSDEWMGDTEMNGFLRPQTLFGTKFESYLVESQKTATPKGRITTWHK